MADNGSQGQQQQQQQPISWQTQPKPGSVTQFHVPVRTPFQGRKVGSCEEVLVSQLRFQNAASAQLRWMRRGADRAGGTVALKGQRTVVSPALPRESWRAPSSFGLHLYRRRTRARPQDSASRPPRALRPGE